MDGSQRQTRYLAATAILMLSVVVDGALFDWRGTAALADVLTHSVEKQAETAEAKVQIYDALWAGFLGVPAKKR